MERKIPDNCHAGNVYNGSCVEIDINAPDLDIEPGDNLEWALTKIIENKTTSTVKEEELNTQLHCLGFGNSLCASKISVRTLTYSLQPKASGAILFSWDLTLITNSLPKGYSVLSVSVVGNSSSSLNAIINSSSQKAGVEIAVSNYPVSVDIRLRINTECGQIELTKYLNLFNSAISGEKTVVMTLNDYSTDTISTIALSDFSELVSSEICLLKDRVSVLESSNTYDAEISSLSQRISALEESLS